MGLGAALVDGLYALLAALGLAALVPGDELQLVGGVALVWIGWRMVRAGGGDALALATFRRGLGVSFAATLANPLTIVSWAAAFTAVVPGLGLARVETVDGPAARRSRSGTLTWFTLLATGVDARGPAARARGALHASSVVAGVAIAAFGVVFVVRGAIALI